RRADGCRRGQGPAGAGHRAAPPAAGGRVVRDCRAPECRFRRRRAPADGGRLARGGAGPVSPATVSATTSGPAPGPAPTPTPARTAGSLLRRVWLPALLVAVLVLAAAVALDAA